MGRPPQKLIPKISWYISIYPFLGIYLIMERYTKLVVWIKKKLEPKHRHLNWLRKLAGIPEK